ncbi:MAG: hypothetical protein DI589_27740 [Shinella sp.]|nr:MAG: hypothetical protein DI589_27740 [Shinella sp.]
MADDPINPKHYAGTACAEIGERLTGNGYQVLKYNWRLGKKDAATIEVGKSIWYLDRELELAYAGWTPPTSLLGPVSAAPTLPDDAWFAQRLEGQDAHVVNVALCLINWSRYGDKDQLHILRADLTAVLKQLEENN